MRLKRICLVFLLILTVVADAKRSRGRSRGSSSSSVTFWNRKTNNKSSNKQQKPDATPAKPAEAPAPQPKPSAPREPEIKKENANLQQSAPNSGRPIGWNVDNQKMGQPNNFDVNKQNVNPSYASGGYPNSGSYNPGYNPGHSYGSYPGYNPQAVPGYNTGSYPNNMGGYGHYPNSGSYNPGQNYGSYPHSGYPQAFPGSNMGSYPNNMGGYGHYPNMGGYGQHPSMGGYGYPPQQTGMMGSLFGGKKYGAYGDYYGMKKSGGFFGKHAFRNVLGGLLVWHLVSGLISTPYKVYSYYNCPREHRQEITLPANVLTLCNENATTICVPGSTAICTQDNRILCVASMTSTAPCQDNKGEMCVKSTVPCIDGNDPLCQNKTTVDNTTTVNLPCFTNMTLAADTASLKTANVTLPASEDNRFCVTAMAVPDPSIQPPPVEEGKTSNVTANDTSINPTNMTNPGMYPGHGYGNMYYPVMYPVPYYGYGYPGFPPINMSNVTNPGDAAIFNPGVLPMNFPTPGEAKELVSETPPSPPRNGTEPEPLTS